MFRKLIFTTALLLGIFIIASAQEVGFYKDIDVYISKINPHPDSLIAASERLISLSDNKILKTAVAGYLFNKFSSSPVMGHETIAIHIAKKYFLSGQLQWHGEGGEAILRLYTEFNENSLIGMQAPELLLKREDGTLLSLNSIKSPYTLLYFFDNNCNVCKAKLPDLLRVVEEKSYLGIEVYAVYTGVDINSLKSFISGNFGDGSAERTVKWNFVYDPDGESAYHKLYNVLGTPQMFLLDRDKKIIGRNLDPASLERLIESDENRIDNLYKESENFIPAYLSIFDLSDTSQFKEAFDPLFKRATRDNRDTYNAIFYNLFEFLFRSDLQYMKEAAIYVAEKYITPYPDLWRDPLYANKYVPEKVNIIKSNREGETIQDTPLYNLKGRKRNLHKYIKGNTLLYFFNPDCKVCEVFTKELIDNYKYFRKKGLRIIAIYAGSYENELLRYIEDTSPPWEILRPQEYNYLDLYAKYEVGQVPQTYLLDKRGKIIAKRVFTEQLKEMFK